jgi:hypothetical protein
MVRTVRKSKVSGGAGGFKKNCLPAGEDALSLCFLEG